MSTTPSDLPPAINVEGLILHAGLHADLANSPAVVQFERTDSGRVIVVIAPIPRERSKAGPQPDGSVLITPGY